MSDRKIFFHHSTMLYICAFAVFPKVLSFTTAVCVLFLIYEGNLRKKNAEAAIITYCWFFPLLNNSRSCHLSVPFATDTIYIFPENLFS